MSSSGQRARESGSQLLAVARVQHRELIRSKIACLGCGERLPLALLAFNAEGRRVALCTGCFGERRCLNTIATMMHTPRHSRYRHARADNPPAAPDDPPLLLTYHDGEAAYPG
ncbi:MAG TPA: hypothetical protein VIL85_21550 [Thermomicrobiales bacterium]|jgi:hypothetical protein